MAETQNSSFLSKTEEIGHPSLELKEMNSTKIS